MFVDSLAFFVDAQSSTVSAASTDIIDTLAAGDTYKDAYFVFRVDTTFVRSGSGAPTCTVQLQTCADSDFATSAPVTLVASAAFVVAQLKAGKFWAVRIPAGSKRYLRGYKVVNTYNGIDFWTTAVYDMFITRDIDLEINKRYLIQ